MTVLLLQEMLVLKQLEVVGKVHREVNLVLSICLSPHGECASQPTDVFVYFNSFFILQMYTIVIFYLVVVFS